MSTSVKQNEVSSPSINLVIELSELATWHAHTTVLSALESLDSVPLCCHAKELLLTSSSSSQDLSVLSHALGFESGTYWGSYMYCVSIIPNNRESPYNKPWHRHAVELSIGFNWFSLWQLQVTQKQGRVYYASTERYKSALREWERCHIHFIVMPMSCWAMFWKC